MILRLVLLPPIALFLYFAAKDAVFHFRSRKPPKLEDLLHLFLGLCELALLVGALWPRPIVMWSGALGTALLGAIDEYHYHHDLPSEEHAYHAKGHLALFLVVVLATALPLIAPGVFGVD